MKGTLPALIIAVLLATAWADSTEAEQWRCLTEKKVGAKVSQDLRPTAFYLDGEEFRVMDAASLLERYKVTPYTDSEASYFMRKSSEDPKNGNNWFGLKMPFDTPNGGTPKSLWSEEFAKALLGSFIFHVESGRFQLTREGGYAWKGPEEGDDAAFSFGTCRPYYD
jgi:hypothetical protein